MHLRSVATVLTACGIETFGFTKIKLVQLRLVATVLTACGIETVPFILFYSSSAARSLQQYLLLAVLKLQSRICLTSLRIIFAVATVLTACGIETVYS